MFRASGIPEAQSQGASNITMHRMLRLMYSDQRTPAPFLFRYENFDTREIREAVGDLVCGLSVYELYETELQLRELGKQFEEKDRRWSALLEGMPREEALVRVEVIDQQLASLQSEQEKLTEEVASVDDLIPDGQVTEFVAGRRAAAEALRALNERIADAEEAAHVNELELSDLQRFLDYLEELYGKLPRTEAASEIIGTIEFTHCPACLAELASQQDDHHCVLCGTVIDPEKARSRYFQIRLDIETQIRETRQLISAREMSVDEISRDLRGLRREHQDKLSEYSVKFELSTSPRQSFVAQRYQRIGQIDRERNELGRCRERAVEMQRLSDEKAELQDQITKLSDRKRALESASKTRRTHSLTRISETAKSILKQDLERQPEFQRASSVALNFPDNSILVDGELNFAESSNVVVKNAAILALLLSACEDPGFFHPRFALFDNIEDKGMEMARSHNFQEIIVRMSEAATLSHQIIVTTSMPNPSLNQEALVVGPHYTHDVRTLDLSGKASN